MKPLAAGCCRGQKFQKLNSQIYREKIPVSAAKIKSTSNGSGYIEMWIKAGCSTFWRRVTMCLCCSLALPLAVTRYRLMSGHSHFLIQMWSSCLCSETWSVPALHTCKSFPEKHLTEKEARLLTCKSWQALKLVFANRGNGYH